MDLFHHAFDTLLGRTHANVGTARLWRVQPPKRVSQEIEMTFWYLADSCLLLVDCELQLAHDLAQVLQSLFSHASSAQNHKVVRVGHEFSHGSIQPKLLPCQHKPAHVNICQ